MFNTWISRIEEQKISVLHYLVAFAAIGAIRFLLDAYSTGLQSTFNLENLPHGLLFFGATLLTMAVLLRILTNESSQKILNIMLAGWLIVWIPPIVDLIGSGGKGGVILSYIFDAPAELPHRFLQFFGGSLTYEFTLGLRVEVAAAMLLLALYTWVKTRSWWKTLLAFLGAYVILFFYAALPTLAATAATWDWSLTREDVLDIVYTPRLFFALDVIDPPRVTGMYLSTFFAVVIPVQLTALFFLDSAKRARAFFANVRGFRFLFQLIAFVAAIILGVRLTGTPFTLGLAEALILLTSFLILLHAWIFSVLLNDLTDLPIDTISNKRRPLVTGLFSVREFRELSVLTGALAVVTAYALGFDFATLAVVLLSLSYLYSMRPFRLRRFPFVATFLMAASVFIALLTVFLLFAPGQAYSAFPRPLAGLILLLFTFVFTVKDLKDRKGDEAAGVLTLPVLLGDQRGKIATGLLVVASFLLVPLFLGSWVLFVLSLGFAAIGFLLVYDRRILERWVFALYALFMLLTLLIA